MSYNNELVEKYKCKSVNFILFFVLIFPLTISAFPKNDFNKTITNPVAPEGADPWVIKHNNSYYYCYSYEDAIYVNKSESIEDAVQMKGNLIWKPEAGREYSMEIWAPELHTINGRWYIYFAADNGENKNHRMFVLESEGADPMGKYYLKGKLSTDPDRWAIDGTVLKYKNNLYFIWSGWEGIVNVSQNLYIAEMENPWTLKSKRYMISKPEYDWEKVGDPYVNEGPEVLMNGDRVFIIYSASGSWTDNYCLGMLTLVNDNPLDPKSWVKEIAPVFSGTTSVISPGHASFVKSPDEKENWIIYHAAKYRGAAWDRNIRMQKFYWDENGNPSFGYPIPDNIKIPAPSR